VTRRDAPKTIDDLVARVIEDALKDDTKLDARVEALKVVTTYHALTLKHPPKAGDEGGLTWEKLQREVHGTETQNGGKTVRGRS
jgi:hypothetical protein